MSTPCEDSKGEQSSSPAAPPTTSTSTSTTLPPISTLYTLTPPSTASSGPDLSRPLPPAPFPFPPSEADNVSWITPANTAELAEDDDHGNDYYDDTNFVFENGRRYHANADGRVLYPLPNDESEQERDDMKHKLALWMMHEKLFYAPVEVNLTQGGMVFDLGESILSDSFFPFFFSAPIAVTMALGNFAPFLVSMAFSTFTMLDCGVGSFFGGCMRAHQVCLHRC